MKTQIQIIPALVSVALAGTTSIEVIMKEAIGATMRAFFDPQTELITNLKPYGCWCNFDEAWRTGGGKPIDDVDASCQALIQGYQCSKMDGCEDVWQTEYVAPKIADLAADAGLPAENHYLQVKAAVDGGWPAVWCANLNPDSTCAQHICTVEVNFAYSHIYALDAARTIVNDYPGKNFNEPMPDDHPDNFNNKFHDGGFDTTASCPLMKANNVDGTIRCCGSHPFRKTYRHIDGVRNCCGDDLGTVVYSEIIQKCCAIDDGSNPKSFFIEDKAYSPNADNNETC